MLLEFSQVILQNIIIVNVIHLMLGVITITIIKILNFIQLQVYYSYLKIIIVINNI